jgi:hypothetical protein
MLYPVSALAYTRFARRRFAFHTFQAALEFTSHPSARTDSGDAAVSAASPAPAQH